MPTYCTCWLDYPNPNHKRANGWKCKDHYTCIRKRTGRNRYTGLKTKCIKTSQLKGNEVKLSILDDANSLPSIYQSEQ